MTQVAILVPVLRRPHRVAPLLASIRRSTPAGVARVIFIADPDDEGECAAVRRARRESSLQVDALTLSGNYAAKINHAARHCREPLLFTGADDLEFHGGWLEAARARIRGPIQVVGTNDLCNARVMAGNHSTHSLLTREYAERGTIDEPGKILHEGYPHEYVDDEFVQTAIKRNAFDFAPDALVEHLHPDAGKAPIDELYAARPARMRQGRKLYRQRRRLWT